MPGRSVVPHPNEPAASKAPGTAFFQPKLSINQPDDMYEQEADAVADTVMRMAGPSSSRINTFFTPAITPLQRKCAHCEEEEKKAQRKENGSEQVSALTHTENYVNTLSGGRTLDEKEKDFFGSRMGYDFSNVRLHTDSAAARSAQSINALAYTTGNDIVFNEGQYNPATDTGKRLLGHELTHVVQQNGWSNVSDQKASRKLVQADFAIEPTTPARAVTVLTAPQIQQAITFNQARHTDAAEIGLMRDILGISSIPQVIDDDFVQAVVRYQAQYGLSQDGQLGHATADRLAKEIIAENTFLGPGNSGSLAPEFTLETAIQTLVSANNNTYADYKAAIQGGTMIQQHIVLQNQQLLLDLKALLTWNEWARCIELLGRLAPTGEEMRTNSTVRAAMNVAWANSNPAITIWDTHDPSPALAAHACNPPVAGPPPSLAHEEGGYVYMNLVTGDLTTRTIPRGAQASLPFPVAPLVTNSVAVGLYHSHPNVGACWGAPFLSGADGRVSAHFGLPMLMIGAFPAVANTSFHAGGVNRRAHLAGSRGGPGTIAPQARADGNYDEV